MWNYEQFTAALAAAVERENLIRDAALLGCLERIGEFKVLPMTVRHYMRLDICRNAFIAGRVPNERDLLQLLKIVRPPSSWISRIMFDIRCQRFLPPRVPLIATRRAVDRWKSRASIRVEHGVALCKAAREYVEEAFQDRPPSGASEGESHYSGALSICASLAREYGGPVNSYLDMPLKVAFQYLKEIASYHAAMAGQKPLLWNPSDTIKRDFLNDLNKLN